MDGEKQGHSRRWLCRTSAGAPPGSRSARSAPGWRWSPRRCWYCTWPIPVRSSAWSQRRGTRRCCCCHLILLLSAYAGLLLATQAGLGLVSAWLGV